MLKRNDVYFLVSVLTLFAGLGISLGIKEPDSVPIAYAVCMVLAGFIYMYYGSTYRKFWIGFPLGISLGLCLSIPLALCYFQNLSKLENIKIIIAFSLLPGVVGLVLSSITVLLLRNRNIEQFFDRIGIVEKIQKVILFMFKKTKLIAYPITKLGDLISNNSVVGDIALVAIRVAIIAAGVGLMFWGFMHFNIPAMLVGGFVARVGFGDV